MTHNFRNKVFERSVPSSSSSLPSSLSFDEQNDILKSFPSTIKFSYEKKTHKKVLSDLYVIIPKGKKYFVWVTHRNRKNICFFLEIGYQNKIMNIFYRHVSFDDILSYGTIFYGTLFTCKNSNSSINSSNTNINSNINSSINKSDIFSVEDIFYYKGDDISNYTYEDKLKIIKNMFDTQLRYNISFSNHGVVFGLPCITSDFIQACEQADKLPYSVYSIQYRNFKDRNSSQSFIEFYPFNSNSGESNGNRNGNINSNTNLNNATNTTVTMIGSNNSNNNSNNTEIENKSKNDNIIMTVKQKTQSNDIYKNFFIKPDLQNDIYYLYQLNATNFDAISKEIAHIPDYKTSVFMNKIFRNIKENNNLDSLEESDEEEEFENIQIDKFVDLNKIIKMRCIFNYKFKKWVPVSIL
jgi:hypothetical protein